MQEHYLAFEEVDSMFITLRDEYRVIDKLSTD